jgi:hypothetical protein
MVILAVCLKTTITWPYAFRLYLKEKPITKWEDKTNIVGDPMCFFLFTFALTSKLYASCGSNHSPLAEQSSSVWIWWWKKWCGRQVQVLNNLLYTHANVTQQINLSCGVFIITYATDIAFRFDPKKPQYVLIQMQTNLQNSVNNKCIFPFPKYELIWHIYLFFLKTSLSLVEWYDMYILFLKTIHCHW